jgi:hypothetical protein
MWHGGVERAYCCFDSTDRLWSNETPIQERRLIFTQPIREKGLGNIGGRRLPNEPDERGRISLAIPGFGQRYRTYGCALANSSE